MIRHCPDHSMKMHRTPLAFAVKNRRLDVVEFLIDLPGISFDDVPNAIDAMFITFGLEHSRLSWSENITMMRRLRKFGFEIPMASFCKLIEFGDKAIVEEFVSDIDPSIALVRTSNVISPELVDFLIEHGADVNFKLKHHLRAVFCGKPATLSRILSHKPDLDVRSLLGHTLLEHACYFHGIEVVKLLVNAGAPIDFNKTACFGQIIRSGDIDLVKKVFKRDQPNNRWWLFIAVNAGHGDIARYFIELGFDVSRAKSHVEYLIRRYKRSPWVMEFAEILGVVEFDESNAW